MFDRTADLGTSTPAALVTSLPYDDLGPFSEGLAFVKLYGKCGFIDTEGHTVVPALYDGAEGFIEGVVQVRLDGKYGYIDVLGTRYWDDAAESDDPTP